jgi:putative phosphoesterase
VIALVADTHMPRGVRILPRRCVELVSEAGLLVHAGDFTAASVLHELESLGSVVAVHGNMDDHELRERLPERVVVEAEGLTIGVVHDAGAASGRAERLRGAFPGCDLLVYGHSHQPEISRCDGVWIVNPGSPTERRRAPSHTMAVVRDGVPELVRLGERHIVESKVE